MLCSHSHTLVLTCVRHKPPDSGYTRVYYGDATHKLKPSSLKAAEALLSSFSSRNSSRVLTHLFSLISFNQVNQIRHKSINTLTFK